MSCSRSWSVKQRCNEVNMAIYKYVVIMRVSVTLLCAGGGGCHLSPPVPIAVPAKSSSPKPANVSKSSDIAAVFASYGTARGVYDAEHGLEGYSSEFTKDPPLAWAYIAMSANVDGTQDVRGLRLSAISFKQNPNEGLKSRNAFISAYQNAYSGYKSRPSWLKHLNR